MRNRRKEAMMFAAMTIAIALVGCAVVELVLRFLPVKTGLRALPVDDQNPVARFTPNRTFISSHGWRLSFPNRGRVNNVGFVNDQDYDSTLTTPLLAIIGDDYVEAAMVPYDFTLQGRLAREVAGHARVYSFGASGAALSQYLAWADYVHKTFQPASMVVVIGPSDADESLLKYWRDQGFYHFRESADGALALERVDYRPSPIRQMLRRSALARYALMNGRGVFRGRVGAVSGNTPTEPSLQRVRESRQAVDTFLAKLPSMAGLAPRRIALVVDAIRPALYDPRERAAAESTYGGQIRRYLVERGRQAGFEVIDMEPIFAAHFARDSVRFEYPVDAHWNEVGHRVAAEAVATSSVFRDLKSGR